MSKKNFTTYTENGTRYQFNIDFFIDHFKTEAKRRNLKINELEQQLADAVYVDKSAVHSWRNRQTTPGDMDKVKQIALFMNVNAEQMVIEIDDIELGDREMGDMNTLTSNPQKFFEALNECKMFALDADEKAELKKVYNAILDYIFEYDDFCTVYFAYEFKLDYTDFNTAFDDAIRRHESIAKCLKNGSEDPHKAMLIEWANILQRMFLNVEKTLLASLITLPAEIFSYVEAVANKVLDEEKFQLPLTDLWGMLDTEESFMQVQEMVTNIQWARSYFKQRFFSLRMCIK